MLALGAGRPSPRSPQVPLAFANGDTEAWRGVDSPHLTTPWPVSVQGLAEPAKQGPWKSRGAMNRKNVVFQKLHKVVLTATKIRFPMTILILILLFLF